MLQNRRAVFRCDASPRIGAGHVVRSMALAAALERRGWDIGFAVNKDAPSSVPALASRKSFVVDEGFDTRSHEPERLRGCFPGADLLVFDHYDRDERDERDSRSNARAIAVIDDLARRHDCDLLIDQTLGRDPGDYRDLVPPGARLLAGANYALLRPEFADARGEALRRRFSSGPPRRLFLSLGATDGDGLLERALHVAIAARPFLEVDIAVGGRTPSLPALREEEHRNPRVRVHADATDIPALMTRADIAIGASGSSAWERCCLGLPSVLVVLGDDQRLVARRLESAGAALLVETEAFEDSLTAVLGALIADENLRRSVARKASEVTDGLGAQRVAEAIELLLSPA